MSTISLQIITPLGALINEEASFVVVPTISGEVTIYPHHIPLISVIQAGELTIATELGRRPVAVWNGVLEVKQENEKTIVILLVDRSEDAKSIDLDRAEAAYKRAEELKNMSSVGDIDFARFEALMDKELNRIKIAKKYR
ncbi:MAG: hypothetical protein RI996_127 [Candidatus Parcubacteria bacterium]|jgi:F-type H+-transporting ATPase subunit epsilon